MKKKKKEDKVMPYHVGLSPRMLEAVTRAAHKTYLAPRMWIRMVILEALAKTEKGERDGK